jgi:hypothetical protein
MEGEKSHLPPVGCSVGLESFPPCYSTGGPPGQVAAVRCAPANAQARSTPALLPGDGPPWTPLDPPGPPWTPLEGPQAAALEVLGLMDNRPLRVHLWTTPGALTTRHTLRRPVAHRGTPTA